MNEKILEKFERSTERIKEYIKTHECRNEKIVIKLDERNITLTREKKTFF